MSEWEAIKDEVMREMDLERREEAFRNKEERIKKEMEAERVQQEQNNLKEQIAKAIRGW